VPTVSRRKLVDVEACAVPFARFAGA